VTLSAWINPSVAPGDYNGDIFGKWRDYSYSLEDYSLYLGTDMRVGFSNGRSGAGWDALPNHCNIITTNPVAVGQWYQLVSTLDSAGTGS
jgi:hypothetical protein